MEKMSADRFRQECILALLKGGFFESTKYTSNEDKCKLIVKLANDIVRESK